MSMSINENRSLCAVDYNEQFDTEFYLKENYSRTDIAANEAPFSMFYLINTIRILKDGEKRFGTMKALEFGGGPTLWASFLLAQYVNSIRFCDYTQGNLDAIRNWIEQKPNAFNWRKIFEKILDANEGSKEKLFEWEARLRDALIRGGLSTCDVHNPNCPILSGQMNDYDIIFSSLCLESACLTIESFNETIIRLVRLLKPGGLLILLMVRNESFYYVNQTRFFCLPLNETKVKQALNQTNELIDIHIDSSNINKEQCNNITGTDGIMVVHAYKKFHKE